MGAWLICFVLSMSGIYQVIQSKPVQKDGGEVDDLTSDMTFILTESYKKSDHHENIVELDILVDNSNRKKRAVFASETKKWVDGVVPYTIDEIHQPITANAKRLINQAMMHIQERTCIKFIPRTNEESYVNFTRGSGCSSYIGLTNIQGQNGQAINIGETCENLDVIVHEILHALGFLHEHTRHDRDHYVIINSTNIRDDLSQQFDKHDIPHQPVSYLNLTYDKQSVMHYGRFTFSKHVNPQTNQIRVLKEYMTIYSIADYKEFLGSKTGLSPMDVQKVNKHYNCPERSTIATPTTETATTETTTSSSPDIVGATGNPNSARGFKSNTILVILVICFCKFYFFWVN